MPNYWIFQATPDVFNLRNALKQGALKTFSVRSHKNRIKEGDKIIFWYTGKATGCYALGEVISKVAVLDFETKELSHIKNTDTFNIPRDAVKVEVEYNLWDNPIFKGEISKTIARSLKAGVPGTNFKATIEQYKAFVDIINMRNAVAEPIVDYRKQKNQCQHSLNQIIYGAPGTGKTYHTVNYALSILEDIPLDQLQKEPRRYLIQRFQAYQNTGQVAIITFHQSFSYEDFIEGIKPLTTENQEVIYEIQDGILKKMALQAAQIEHLEDRFVLIIDEINRGNVAAIFGELITLIETDKRQGKKENISIQLPYSKKAFSVPQNLYLLGTMNTADRNTEILDNALRRRFAFIEQLPNPSLLHTIGKVDISDLLQTINKRIEVLLDRDHLIGHAYFLEAKNIDDLQEIFSTKIIPLLQEYFYGDWSKIGLILGKSFVKTTYIHSSQQLFADFEDDTRADYEGKAMYSITSRDDWNEKTFLSIYE